MSLLIFGCSIFTSSACLAQTVPLKEIRILIDADKDFVEKFETTEAAIQFIRELVAKVDAIYRNQLGLTLKITDIHLWDSEDPFDESGLSASLASFAQYAEVNYRSQYSYDVAHLLVGNSLGGEGGIAYQGSACGDAFFSQQAYGISQPDIDDQFEFNAHLFAHELGHNLNAEHDMFPSCAVKKIMCPGQIGADFSEEAKIAIASYVSNRAAAGCFPSVMKSDPVKSVVLKISTSSSGLVQYKVNGAQDCTSLTLVGSPSKAGLKVLFGYLQVGKLRPSSIISAKSKNVLALRGQGQKKLFIGAYCDGQLAPRPVALDLSKLRAKKATSSAVLALRSLQKAFMQTP